MQVNQLDATRSVEESVFAAECQTSGQTQKQFNIKPHRRRRRAVQSYSPGWANAPFYEGTLAPSDEHDCWRIRL